METRDCNSILKRLCQDFNSIRRILSSIEDGLPDVDLGPAFVKLEEMAELAKKTEYEDCIPRDFLCLLKQLHGFLLDLEGHKGIDFDRLNELLQEISSLLNCGDES